MEIKIKLAPDAIMPTRATEGSAGWDLYCPSEGYSISGMEEPYAFIMDTGVYVEIPEGYVGLVFERSSLWEKGISLNNKVGVIDSDYRGSIKLPLSSSRSLFDFRKNPRIAQLVIVPCPEVQLVLAGELSETERGAGGLGSTGV